MSLSAPDDRDNCSKAVEQEHKFYLSFENSICKEQTCDRQVVLPHKPEFVHESRPIQQSAAINTKCSGKSDASMCYCPIHARELRLSCSMALEILVFVCKRILRISDSIITSFKTHSFNHSFKCSGRVCKIKHFTLSHKVRQNLHVLKQEMT